MNKSDQIDQLSAALSTAQGELKPVLMNAKNPFLGNRYADLGAVIDAIRPVLVKHGLAVAQFPISSEKTIGIETVLTHASGQWMSGSVSIETTTEKGKSAAQVAGSIITYLRRYSLASVLGLYSDEDTDGNAPDKPSSSGQTIKPAAQPAPFAKPWYETAFEAVRAKSAVWDKPLGKSPQGNAFIDFVLKNHVGDGQWFAAKENFVQSVRDISGFKTPEEMSWPDAVHLVGVATGKRAHVGDVAATITRHGIFDDEAWAKLIGLSGVNPSDKVDNQNKADLLNAWLKSLVGAEGIDLTVCAESFGKIMRGEA